MQKIVLAAVAAASLTACGSKSDANEKNFGAAISQYLAAKGELCLGLSKWPVEVQPTQYTPKDWPSLGEQMAALEEAGLVASAESDVEHKTPQGAVFRKDKMRRYTLTDAAKPFIRETQEESLFSNGQPEKQTDLCWGKKVLDKVVKWEGPIKLGDYQEAGVVYLYKIDNLAEWAKQPKVQSAFRRVKPVLDGAGKKEEKHRVKLTSEGWEPLGLK